MEFLCRLIVQRRYGPTAIRLWKTFRSKLNAIPVDEQNCSPSHRNRVHLPTGMLFGITTEWRSASARNRVHLRPDSPLEDGNRDRPLFPVFFGNIDSSQWLCPILAFFEPLVELSDILFRVRLVLLVRDAVDPGTGILSQTPERLIQLLACDQVSNRVELPFRIFLGEFSY